MSEKRMRALQTFRHTKHRCDISRHGPYYNLLLQRYAHLSTFAGGEIACRSLQRLREPSVGIPEVCVAQPSPRKHWKPPCETVIDCFLPAIRETRLLTLSRGDSKRSVKLDRIVRTSHVGRHCNRKRKCMKSISFFHRGLRRRRSITTSARRYLVELDSVLNGERRGVRHSSATENLLFKCRSCRTLSAALSPY